MDRMLPVALDWCVLVSHLTGVNQPLALRENSEEPEVNKSPLLASPPEDIQIFELPI